MYEIAFTDPKIPLSEEELNGGDFTLFLIQAR